MKNINIKLNSILSMLILLLTVSMSYASSHREAPLISNDPLADNVDLYAFRSPDNPDMITIIATYVPLQLPHGGPNYYSFGENVRYEIHVDNDASVAGDEITYRFTFNIVNEDPTTFFNIRLGAQNQKATYTLERSMDGGATFETIVTDGYVPPNNIGPRSIEGAAGLNTTYDALFARGVSTATTGESVFAGPTDDPFFVDLGGIFDLGDAPRQSGTPVDGVACYNVSALAIQVPISTLLKANAPSVPTNILDSDYIIGVWASASRPAITTLSSDSDPTYSGDWRQVSRLGMPLTNEAVIAIGDKDYWNGITPYDEITDTQLDPYFYNPELALYMDDDQFGAAVPAFAALRIQEASLGAFDFTNGADGLFGLKDSPALDGTALAEVAFGGLLLPGPGLPRSVDLWPIFHTGAPNLRPYQLATGKDGDPLAEGKPFINNFLPNGGDMLRLNMAVPVTPRDDANFSSLGLVQAAAIGLTVAPFNETADLEFIPNMDGFPNGRRLEDDVTRIELQAVGGVVLAAIGLWYDDYDPMDSNASPVTQDLLNVLSFTTGVETNDRPFTGSFPYLAQPFSGTGDCSGEIYVAPQPEGPAIDEASFKLFVSSNTQPQVGIYSIDEVGNSSLSSFDVTNDDSDGNYFDRATGTLYQLDRTNNVVNAYSDVINSVANGITPTLTATSTSDFSNGRGITVSGSKLVVAQDADDTNGMTNRFIVYNITPTSITLDRIIESSINLWGVDADGSTLYAIEDNSDRIGVYSDFFSNNNGSTPTPTLISIDGMVRTHGLHYESSTDLMILTDVADGGVADDGALNVVPNWSTATADGQITAGEQFIIKGASSNLGNPVDVAYDKDLDIIYVAERANGGGRILTFANPTSSGDIAPTSNVLYAGASSVHLADCVNVIDAASFKLFTSSNTQPQVGIYNIDANGNSTLSSFDVMNEDSDGNYFDRATGTLYLLDRTNNVVNAYSDVINAVANGNTPVLSATSTSDFSNGRGITVSGNKLVVAQDADDTNGMTNRFVIYDISPTSITLDRIIESSINLWGVDADGSTLYAVEDNSNRVGVYTNFFSNTNGSTPTPTLVSVDGIVRTHGLHYESSTDLMILTDVADGGVSDDGALNVVPNWSVSSADGQITAGEQFIIKGASSILGNPVDVAYDKDLDIIYVAERANGGGRILTFANPTSSGDIAPTSNELYAGASSVHLADCLNFDDEDVEPVGLVYFNLDACSANSTGTAFNFNEFTPEYPNTLDCGSVVVDGTLYRDNPTINSHSCTPGFNGLAMCVSSDSSCDFNPASTKRIIIDFTVFPGDQPITISSLNFMEKSPLTYEWINGASGTNNYPTQYGVRIMANGVPIFTSADNAATTDWTLESFDFSNDSAFTFSEETDLRIFLVGYCPVGNGAMVSAWDIDELSIMGNCQPSQNKAAKGYISSPEGLTMSAVEVSVDNALLPEFPQSTLTNELGEYAFTQLPIDVSYEISAEKNDDYTNGVSTLDLVLIQDHIIGYNALDNVYDMIAADINNDFKVSALDIVQLRKLVLGVIPTFPDNGSWKFIDSDHIFDMNNPWDYRESRFISQLTDDASFQDFMAVKIGDVNGTVLVNAQSAQTEVRGSATIELTTEDQNFRIGDEVRIPIKANNFANVRGLQSTLQYNGLTVIDVAPGTINLSNSNYALLDNGIMTMSWVSNNQVSVKDGDVLFTIVVTANRNGNLSDYLVMTDDKIIAEAYVGADLAVVNMSLFIETRDGFTNNTLFNNVPNPFSTTTNISFKLATDGDATLTLFDITGRVIKSYTNTYTAGQHTVTVDALDLNDVSGVVYYKLETENYSNTKQMILMK